MSQSVLVVAPHPDDEVLGCGGTIARHADAGDQVHVLIMTKGDPDLYPDDDQAALEQDIRAAHAVINRIAVGLQDPRILSQKLLRTLAPASHPEVEHRLPTRFPVLP